MGDAPRTLDDPYQDLLEALLSRRDMDQASRAALTGGDPDAFPRLIAIDDENAVWLETVIDTVGWPGRSMVGDEGAHAAWLLAQHADRRPSLQRRCLALLEEAVAAREASPGDLVHLIDRVLLARGDLQVYGTQMAARDGRYVACRLRDPETVDDRRATVGLGALEVQLQEMLDRYGPPTPAQMLCPDCRDTIEVWLPELGGYSTVSCPSCHSTVTIRPHIHRTQDDPADDTP